MQEFYEKTADYKNAFFYQKENSRLDDSIRNEHVRMRTADMSLRYQQDSTLLAKNILIEQQKVEMLKLHEGRFFWIGVCVLVLVIACFIYLYEKKRRALLLAQSQRTISSLRLENIRNRMSPHFIFNVLETLRYEIAIDAAKASDMVMAFANLMRYSIYYGSTIVPLQTDIEYINDYLLLQKMRYNRRLNYHIDIPEELMGCKIPKLLLQPVVENSLVHGMKDIRSIAINISAWKEKGQLKLCVEDNGSGIREEKLEELRKGLEQEDVYREHIGLYNSHRVVRLLYGPESGMTIESSPGNGTKVTVTLPADMEEI